MMDSGISQMCAGDSGVVDLSVPEVAVHMLENNARGLTGLACFLERATHALGSQLSACSRHSGVPAVDWESASGLARGVFSLANVCVGQAVWAAASWQLLVRAGLVNQMGRKMTEEKKRQLSKRPVGRCDFAWCAENGASSLWLLYSDKWSR